MVDMMRAGWGALRSAAGDELVRRVAFHYRSGGPKLRRTGEIKGPSALVAGAKIPENREIAGGKLGYCIGADLRLEEPGAKSCHP